MNRQKIILDALRCPVCRPNLVDVAMATVPPLGLFTMSTCDFLTRALSDRPVIDLWNLFFAVSALAVLVFIAWHTIAQLRAYNTDPRGKLAVDTAKQMLQEIREAKP